MDVVVVTADSDPRLIDSWHHLLSATEAEQIPGVEPPSFAESLLALQSTAAQQRWGLLALDGDIAVGCYSAEEPLAEDTCLAQVWMGVDSSHRRRGVGTALVAAARLRHAEHGRSHIESSVRVGAAASAFARDLGARVTQIELCNVLQLVDLRLDLRSVARPATGYELRTWWDTCPDDLVAAYAQAHRAMDDAPRSGASHDESSWDAARVRAAEDRHRHVGIRSVTAAAVHLDSATVAGYTDITLTGRPSTAIQDDTGVVRAHRGHGLGLALKATNLLELRRHAPQVRTVMTWNAESNTHMLAVNDRLGFRPHSRWEEVELVL